jgi:hypothetical protein
MAHLIPPEKKTACPDRRSADVCPDNHLCKSILNLYSFLIKYKEEFFANNAEGQNLKRDGACFD